jgi:hypothetical protein
MVSEMHVFDLKTYHWEDPIYPTPGELLPPARYFHSADPCAKFRYDSDLLQLTRAKGEM